MFIEYRVAEISDGVVKKVFYTGISSDMKKEEAEKKAIDDVRKCSKEHLVIVPQGTAVSDRDYLYLNKKFVKREREMIHLAYEKDNKVCFTAVNSYSDKKDLYQDIKEDGSYFIVPDDQIEELKKLPIEALSLEGEPDIVIGGGA